MNGGGQSRRALLLAPTERDAAAIETMLCSAGMAVLTCANASVLLEKIGRGAGLAIVAEEAFVGVDLAPFQRWIETQPSWSDFPFIILSRCPRPVIP